LELQQVFHGLGSARAGSEVPGGTETASGAPPQGADDDDVIDADFTVS
jgi:hypothetical protein